MVILFCKCSGKNFGTLCHTNGAIKCQSSASYVCLTGRGSYVGNVAIAYQRKFCDLKKGGSSFLIEKFCDSDLALAA